MKSKRTPVPELGTIGWLVFDPQAGREQADRRPANVLSHSLCNEKTGLAVLCSITSKVWSRAHGSKSCDRKARHGRSGCIAIRNGTQPKIWVGPLIPDQEGLANVLEATMGLAQLVSEAPTVPALGFVSFGEQPYPAITFTRDSVIADLATTVEWSDNLADWAAGSSYGPGGTVSSNGTTVVSRSLSGGIETITVRSNVPVEAGQQFLRVSVAAP